MKLIRLWERPKKSILLISLVLGIILFLLGTIIISIILAQTSWKYFTEDFFIEFVFPPEGFLDVILNYGVPGIELKIILTYWDFLYLMGYCLALSSLFLLISRKVFKAFHRFSIWMSLTPFIAGFFNVIKNIGLLILLYNYSNVPPFIPFIVSVSGFLKLVFLFLGIVYFIFIIIVYTLLKLGNMVFPDKK